MAAGGVVQVDRDRGWPWFRFQPFSLELDGTTVERVRGGQSVRVPTSSGEHRVRVRFRATVWSDRVTITLARGGLCALSSAVRIGEAIPGLRENPDLGLFPNAGKVRRVGTTAASTGFDSDYDFQSWRSQSRRSGLASSECSNASPTARAECCLAQEVGAPVWSFLHRHRAPPLGPDGGGAGCGSQVFENLGISYAAVAKPSKRPSEWPGRRRLDLLLSRPDEKVLESRCVRLCNSATVTSALSTYSSA